MQANMKIKYFVYLHLIIKYGITFWCNSADNKSIFPLQNTTVRILTTGERSRTHINLFPQHRKY
jgi:hypothetical protein